jgi:hypothetical protein
MQRKQLRAHAVRLEVTFTGTIDQLTCEEVEVEETMHVPFGVKWLHCELTHCAEHQECVLDEQVFRRQWSIIARAINR